nr:zinc ribbon domain-containing protein [Nocardiopsis mwathae]
MLADIPSTGHLGSSQAQRFALAGDDHAARSAEFLDFTAHHIAQGRKVVALYPAWRADEAVRTIRFARGALRTDHIAAVSADLSPLALSLMADQLAYLAPYLPSGIIAALAKELPEHMLAGGWLRSVGNLSTIPITLKQHLGSFAPKVKFLAFCAPIPRVGRVKRMDPAPNIPFRPIDPVQMLYSAGDDIDTDTFDQQFIPVIRTDSTRKLPTQPLGKEYWGSSKYVEFVAFSAHPNALTQPARSIRPVTCSWCGEQVAGGHCPFCGAANQMPVGRPPGYSRAGNVPPPVNTQPHSRGSGPAQAALDRYRRQQTAPQAPRPHSNTAPQQPPQPAPGRPPQRAPAAHPPAPQVPPGPAGPPGPSAPPRPPGPPPRNQTAQPPAPLPHGRSPHEAGHSRTGGPVPPPE